MGGGRREGQCNKRIKNGLIRGKVIYDFYSWKIKRGDDPFSVTVFLR